MCNTRKPHLTPPLPEFMLFFLDKFAGLKCGWNKRPLTESDFYRLCKRHKVAVQEMPLSVGGFYYSMLGRHYIAINSRLGQPKKLLVMFHEFAHFLIHAPDHGSTANFHGIGKRTRKEFEADAFAACALIPKHFVEKRSVQEMVEEEGLPEDLVMDRVNLFQTLGI